MKEKLLINFPESFFTNEALVPLFDKLKSEYEVKTTSYNTPEEIVDDLVWANYVIMWAWPAFSDEMIKNAKELKYCGFMNTTKETAISCLNNNIPISEIRHAWSPAVAEMALTLALSGLRKTAAHQIAMRNGCEDWVIAFPDDIDINERSLYGRTVGVVGFGGIGQRLCKLMKPFDVEMKIFDPYLPETVAKEYGVAQMGIEEVCADSDVVVLCAANTKETEGIINKKIIDNFKKDSVLVNVGRSSLVDMDALLERAKRNDMTMMLDVHDNEPFNPGETFESPFRELPNVFLTPHRAGGIMQSVINSLVGLAVDMENVKAGKEQKYKFTESMLKCLPE